LGELFQYIEVSSTIKSRVYIAETGLGVKFLVKEDKGDIWALHLVPEINLAFPKKLRPPPWLFVPPVEAPAVKDKLAVVFVGTAVNPPVTIGSDDKQATLTNPHSEEETIHDLWFHPTTAYVVRLDTGAILAKASYAKNGEGMFSAGEAQQARTHRK
jgi:hypothetical protein